MKKSIKKQRAFTLVELLITVAITSILTTVVVVGYMNFLNKAAIATDEYLASQLNRLLEGHRIYEKVEKDNEIANVIKPTVNPDVEIQTMKLDMNIYYNTNDKEFQVLKDVEAVGYENLHYYLNLSTNNFNPSDLENNIQNNTSNNSSDIQLNNSFYQYNDISRACFEGKDTSLESRIMNDTLYVSVWVDESGEYISTTIDLIDIIETDDTNLNERIIFNITEDDIICYDNKNYENNYEINGTLVTFFSPGIYRIDCIYENIIKTIDVYVKNVYFSLTPNIKVENIQYGSYIIETSENIYDITIDIPKKYGSSNNIFGNITISDYQSPIDQYLTNMKISNDSIYLNDITVLVEIGSELKEIKLNESIGNYSIIFSSIDLQETTEISITYRYQARNGLYYYHTDTIPLSIQ